jgi:transposase InsO family protein
MAELVFATLKTEAIYGRSWPTRHESEMKVFAYREGLYNTRRRHSRLGNPSPTDYETVHLTQTEVSAWRGSLQGTVLDHAPGFACCRGGGDQ